MKNQMTTAADANILRMDGMASEIRPRWMEYASHTMLFKRIIVYVVSDTLSVDPFAMIMKICGYSAKPDTVPVSTANLSIQ